VVRGSELQKGERVGIFVKTAFSPTPPSQNWAPDLCSQASKQARARNTYYQYEPTKHETQNFTDGTTAYILLHTTHYIHRFYSRKWFDSSQPSCASFLSLTMAVHFHLLTTEHAVAYHKSADQNHLSLTWRR